MMASVMLARLAYEYPNLTPDLVSTSARSVLAMWGSSACNAANAADRFGLTVRRMALGHGMRAVLMRPPIPAGPTWPCRGVRRREPTTSAADSQRLGATIRGGDSLGPTTT